MLRWFCDGTKIRRLCVDHGIGRSVCYRAIHEGRELLAWQAPDLRNALIAARLAGYDHRSVDGTLVETDRISIPEPTKCVDPWWSKKAHNSRGRGVAFTAVTVIMALVTAQIHQRIRERLPHLPVLVDTAEAHLDTQARLVAAANATPAGEIFDHAGTSYRRTLRVSHTRSARHHGTVATLVTDLATGRLVDLTRAEDEAFWT